MPCRATLLRWCRWYPAGGALGRFQERISASNASTDQMMPGWFISSVKLRVPASTSSTSLTALTVKCFSSAAGAAYLVEKDEGGEGSWNLYGVRNAETG